MLLLALPDGVAALGVGTVLALGAAAVVLSPLMRDHVEAPLPRVDVDDASPSMTAVDALREIEFDQATGKLSDDDYRDLKAEYTQAALGELRARDAAAAGVDDDAIERTIRSFRGGAKACVACGPRPESDALFCSNCGRYLAGHCVQCGSRCDAEGQRFCGECGTTLAA